MAEEKQYQTQQIWIKKGHKMYSYFQTMCENSKNMNNTTLFYVRQIYTALTTDKLLHTLQKEVLDILNENIDARNEIQKLAYEKALEKEMKKPEDKRKKVKLNEFSLPNSSNPYVDYNFLDCLFKVIKQPDYRSLPAQSSQATMKVVFENWKSFFNGLKEYKENPSKFTGKPKIPGYSQATVKEVHFTNQDCVIKENKFLKFPKTKEKLNIGKLGISTNKLKSVRVIPRYGQFVVEMVFEKSEKLEKINVSTNNRRLMSIDLGLENLATITTNTGMAPVLLKGGNVKSINQYYNKMRAYYYGILRQGKLQNEGQFTSKRLNRLDMIRYRKLKDLFHKASFFICELANFEEVDTIIIGQNKGWKQNSNMGKRNNQNFVQVPFNLLISMIQYKAEELGINVIVTEESYTSKASFLDEDDIPTYGQTDGKVKFSGTRRPRGLYRSSNGTILSSDVNGSGNIMRKYAIKEGIALNISDVNVKDPLTHKIA